jgi:tetrapyrrole methylase family protein/MazG family protein
MDISTQSPFDRLLSVIRRLRAPDGCAWDRKQTPETLRNNLIEEAYECVSAISAEDNENLREELGDILMLVCMLAVMKEERGAFSVEDVLHTISEKLIRRHPHVFGGEKIDNVEQIVSRWDQIKSEEKGKPPTSSDLENLPKSLPPLEKASRIQEKVSKVGFDWDGPAPVWAKLNEEIAELSAAEKSGDRRLIEEEIGDILFTVVNLSRLMGVDPGLALHGTNDKFMRRFLEVEKRLHNRAIAAAEAGLPLMDEIWNQIKAEERKRSK